MRSANDFWLNVHQLADTYAREGRTPRERMRNIADQFQAMPHIAQREMLADLVRLVVNLPDVYTVAVSLANQSLANEIEVAKPAQRESG